MFWIQNIGKGLLQLLGKFHGQSMTAVIWIGGERIQNLEHSLKENILYTMIIGPDPMCQVREKSALSYLPRDRLENLFLLKKLQNWRSSLSSLVLWSGCSLLLTNFTINKWILPEYLDKLSE